MSQDHQAIPISFLDLAPVPQGKSTAEGIFQTVAMAKCAEEVGLNRYWMAEHHNMPGIASAATAVLLSHIGSQTQSIRIVQGLQGLATFCRTRCRRVKCWTGKIHHLHKVRSRNDRLRSHE